MATRNKYLGLPKSLIGGGISLNIKGLCLAPCNLNNVFPVFSLHRLMRAEGVLGNSKFDTHFINHKISQL